MRNTITTAAVTGADNTDKARQLIELGLALDPEARSDTLARLIAASLHTGPGGLVEPRGKRHAAQRAAVEAERAGALRRGGAIPLARRRQPSQARAVTDRLRRFLT